MKGGHVRARIFFFVKLSKSSAPFATLSNHNDSRRILRKSSMEFTNLPVLLSLRHWNILFTMHPPPVVTFFLNRFLYFSVSTRGFAQEREIFLETSTEEWSWRIGEQKFPLGWIAMSSSALYIFWYENEAYYKLESILLNIFILITHECFERSVQEH